MKRKKFMLVLMSVVIIFSIVTGNAVITTQAIASPTITVGNVTGRAGQEVTVDVSLSNNPGICTAYLNIFYDEELTLVSVEDAGLLNDYVFGNLLTANPYRVTWDDSLAQTNNTENGIIVHLTFKIADNASYGEHGIRISYNNGDIFNLNMEDQSFELVDGGVTVKCNHVLSSFTSNLDATCTVDGTKSATCTICGERVTVNDVGSALGHNFIDGVCSVCGANDSGEPSVYIKGDINNDKTINGKDANFLLQICSGIIIPDVRVKEAADVFNDGIINAKDSNTLICYLCGAISAFD